MKVLFLCVFCIFIYVSCLCKAETQFYYPISLLDASNWTLPISSEMLLTVLQPPIVPVLLMGVSRSGKSLLLNFFARYLIESQQAVVDDTQLSMFMSPGSLNSYPFGVSSEMTRCTVGINAFVLRRKAGGYFLLMDAEGSDNGNRKVVSKILGIGRHLTNLLVFTDDNRFDRALDALGRLVAYGYTSSGVHSGQVGVSEVSIMSPESWPNLVMVLNKVLESLPDDDMTFYRDQIAHKQDDDEATNRLRQVCMLFFVYFLFF
jgi:hypothetical protein